MNELLWQRSWSDVQSTTSQSMFAIPLLPDGPPVVGVRITIRVDLNYHAANSYATAEVFDGTQWHAIAGLPAQLMHSGEHRAAGAGARWSSEGAEADVRELLRDASLALSYRAMGPAEYAERGYTRVVHPLSEP